MICRKDSKGSTSKRGGNFATSRNGGQHSSIGSTVATRLVLKCPLSNGHHVLALRGAETSVCSFKGSLY